MNLKYLIIIIVVIIMISFIYQKTFEGQKKQYEDKSDVESIRSWLVYYK